MKAVRYEIRIRGTLSPDWTEWFDGMEIRQEAEDETVLAGPVPDQAALHGLLARIRDMNLMLISVNPSKNDRLLLVAPCGIDCGLCSLYTCKDDPELMDRLVSRGIAPEKLPCAGCRNIAGDCPVIGGKCETYDCIRRKGVDFCFACDDFPCSKLCPVSERADALPHNLKTFNLCTIRRIGVEGFVKDSGHLEQLYFKGKIEIGKGPKLTG